MFAHPTIFNQWIKVINKLTKPKSKVVIVGGFVRDWLLLRVKTDIDIAVSTGALQMAADFAKAIRGVYVLLDEEHGCARVVKKIKGQPFTVDFSDFRAKGLLEDLGLRDFTLNSLTVVIDKDLTLENFESRIVDFNGALKDIKTKKIRMNASRVFADDPLRLLRAFSLSSQLGFTIEAKTLAQIKKDAHLVTQPAAERVREEIFKVLQSPHTADTFELMDSLGLLEMVIPQLLIMRDVEQGGYHHLDVFKHSMQVLREFEGIVGEYASDEKISAFLKEEVGGDHNRLALLKLACLLHDIGKPETRKHDGKRYTFHSHEHVGAGITRHIAKQLRVTVKERYFLEDMVKLHLRPGYLSNFDVPTEKMFYRFFRDAKGEAVSLALLAMADQAATGGPLSTQEKLMHHTKICREIIRRAYEPAKPLIPKQRLITGKDLIKQLKLKPSPLFAVILSEVEEQKALGKISDQKQALALAKRMALASQSPEKTDEDH